MKVALLNALIVGAGGFLGAIGRYSVGGLVRRIAPFATYPYATLLVNVIGCLAIGLLHGLAESRQVLTPEFRLLILIGFLGAFTTFSTFGYELFEMVREGERLKALLTVLLHVGLGLLAVWGGHALAGAR